MYHLVVVAVVVGVVVVVVVDAVVGCSHSRALVAGRSAGLGIG